MGKPTGFLDFNRKNSLTINPKERIKNYNEFHIPLAFNEQQKQGARCMDCGVPFCQCGIMLGGMTCGCPLNNLIPEWNDLLYTGNMELALKRLLLTNNFPEFTSRVCPAPCETACTCNLNTDPVCIKENERAIVDYGYDNNLMKANPLKIRTGKKVAIIGSGPSGLAAADQLNKRGHCVTVYERNDRLGGLLMYGIPNMKLEKEVVQNRIRIMEEEGIHFIVNADVGKNTNAKEIINNYDCIILACGASKARNIEVKGRNAKGIYFALDYLKGVTKSLLDTGTTDQSYINAMNKKVIVIGGGDTGNDCVGTAIRQGAKSVIQLEMMSKPPIARSEDNPWPEWPKTLKIDYGQEEAIAVYGNDPRVFETTVKEFVADKEGNLNKIIAVKLEKVYEQELNRYIMKEVPGSEFELDADLAFIAAGYLGAEDYILNAFELGIDSKSYKFDNANKYNTKHKKIFVTGDMFRGQSLVVWAIYDGRETAKVADDFLMGYNDL